MDFTCPQPRIVRIIGKHFDEVTQREKRLSSTSAPHGKVRPWSFGGIGLMTDFHVAPK